jgi:hypothetical protein
MFTQPSQSTTTYSYKLFDKTLVLELYRHKPQLRPEAYLSTSLNGELDAIRAAVSEGYRWIRSEGEIAVFEKQCPMSGIPIASIPRHIAAAAAKFKEGIPS